MTLHTRVNGQFVPVETRTFEPGLVYYYGSTIPASVIYVTRIENDTVFYVKLVDQLYHCSDEKEFRESAPYLSAGVQTGIANMTQQLARLRERNHKIDQFAMQKIERILQHDASGFDLPTAIDTVEEQRERQRLEAEQKAKEPPTRYIDIVDVAKMARAKLKEAYPGHKFSVRSSRYAGGSSIDVRWVDGPTTKEAESIVGHLHGATFDGMVDLKSRHDSTDPDSGEKVRYGNDYIFCSRDLSREAQDKAWAATCEKWMIDSKLAWWETTKHGEYLRFSYERIERLNSDPRSLYSKESHAMSFYTKPAAQPETESTPDPAPQADSGAIVGEYKGRPTITLPRTRGKGFTFGVSKAKLILEHLEAIQAFVNDNA